MTPIGFTMCDKLQFVVATQILFATADKLKFAALLHRLGPGHLRDDLTKLAKAMFLV